MAFIRALKTGADEMRPLYASFYGCQHLADLDNQLFLASFPNLKNEWISRFSGVAKSGLKALFEKVATVECPSINLGSFINTKNAVLCFDDFERATIAKEIALGYINTFVEHRGTKVIILCNEEELYTKEQESYRKIKEKLIGKTQAFQIDPKTVLQSLITEHESFVDFHAFVSLHASLVLELFVKSEKYNIRSLRRAIVCLHKVFDALSEESIDPNKLPEQLIYAVAPTAFELCAHGTEPKDIRDIHASDFTSFIGYASLGFGSNKSGEVSYQQIYHKRYFETFDILDYKKAVGCPPICEYLITGFLDKPALFEWAKEIIKVPDEREERIKLLLSDFRDVDDRVFRSMWSQVLQDVESGNIDNSYTYVRLFSTFQWFTKVKLIPFSIEQIMRKFINGINKACQDGTLKYNERLSREVDHPIGETDTDEHKVFCKHALELNTKIHSSQERKHILKLAQTLKADASTFIDAIISDEYRFKPIFHELDADVLVKQLLLLPNSMLSRFVVAMSGRYLHGAFKELSVEVPVLSKMKELLETFCQESKKDEESIPLSLFLIQRLAKNLEEILETLHKLSQPESTKQ